MQQRTSHGFSLIELLLVVSMVCLIAAIAVPSLVKARDAADSAVAVGQLRSMNKSQTMYWIRESRFARLDELNTFADGEFGRTIGSTIRHREFTFTMFPAPTDVSLQTEYTIIASKIVNGQIVSQYTMSGDGVVRTVLP
jgi:prepilin-type N-terminal cleavage/methylation domain-containing protein